MVQHDRGEFVKMLKKIVYVLALLNFFVFQIEPLRGETKDIPLSETKETQPPKMSEREFFIAVQMPEYSDYTKKAVQLYNEDKYKESMEISKKVLNLYNERYEEIKKGYEKYGASKEAQKRFECFPIFQYATAVYADASATEHGAYTIQERYFMLIKAHKLFEYVSAMYPNDYKQTAYYSTTGRLIFNAKTKSKFTEEEIKKYEDAVKPYDFAKEEMRTLKNAVELIDKVDKIAKEYKPKTEISQPVPAEVSADEKVTELKGSATGK